MLFNSYLFVLLFLPMTITGYFFMNSCKKYKMAELFLLTMSLWFYGYFNPKYLPVIMTSIFFNYTVHKVFSWTEKQGVRKLFLTLAIIFNVGVLFYFKYYDFFLENINYLFKLDFTLNRLILPLGISFFTFQQLSFVIDAYRDEVPDYSFLEYALFVTFFPQLIAGPIVTHDELVPQFADKSNKVFSSENFSKGLYIFALGLAKKVLIADTFGNAANWGFTNYLELNTTNALLAMLAYTIQIYFDFSGYCDMAIGIGKMLNIDLPINFNSPYKALTITEFWDRWHMTLTRFFTRYVYIPLGGSRNGTWITYRNTMIVFFVSGLWHGANWTFVLWGGIHGGFIVLTKAFKQLFEKMHPALNWFITFSFVNIAWVFFRSDSILHALVLLKRIAVLNIGAIRDEFVDCFNLPEFVVLSELTGRDLRSYPYLYLVLFFLFTLSAMVGGKNSYEKMLVFRPSVRNSMMISGLLVWCILSFSGISTFLYFNF